METPLPGKPVTRSLDDPWDPSGFVPLDGSAERNGYAPMLLGVGLLFLAFIFFQVVISPIALVVLMLAKGVDLNGMLDVLGGNLEKHATTLLIANTIGQFIGLALPALLFARLNSSRPAAFVRLRPAPFDLTGLAVLGLVALFPVVQWLGSVNSNIPLPDWLKEFEQSQLKLIEQILLSQTNVIANLFMLAITPALCEEVLFRGYTQRQSERALGAWGGILFSGIAFGFYHLRLTQIVPLSLLGLYMAWLAWRTGSLWPSIVVHFANNAFAVVLGAYTQAHPELGMKDIENINIPWYYVASGAVLFVLVTVFLNRLALRYVIAPRKEAAPFTNPGA